MPLEIPQIFTQRIKQNIFLNRFSLSPWRYFFGKFWKKIMEQFIEKSLEEPSQKSIIREFPREFPWYIPGRTFKVISEGVPEEFPMVIPDEFLGQILQEILIGWMNSVGNPQKNSKILEAFPEEIPGRMTRQLSSGIPRRFFEGNAEGFSRRIPVG